MKFIITEIQYSKIIKEQINSDGGVKGIIDRMDSSVSNILHSGAEDYGLDSRMFIWFKRRFSMYKDYLAHVIDSVLTDDIDWLKFERRTRFIDLVLSYSLLDFFYNVDGKQYELEDFLRNGEQEGWLYLTREMYGDMLGKIYDELKM